MNSIKFSPWNVELKGNETIDIERQVTARFDLGYGLEPVTDQIALTVVVDTECNACCKFCMNELDEEFHSHQTGLDGLEHYTTRLSDALKFLKPLHPVIAITGGEPTQSDFLLPTLALTKGYPIKSFSTNGSGMFNEVDGKPVWQHLVNHKVTQNINLSRAAVADAKNLNVMGTLATLSNKHIYELAENFSTAGAQMRMGCVLSKNGVNSLSDILDYYHEYHRHSIYTSLFREMVQKDHPKAVQIDAIVAKMSERDDFEPIRQMKGIGYTVSVYRYRCDHSYDGTNDALVKVYRETPVEGRPVQDLVFYPDGQLYVTDWHGNMREVKGW